MNSINIVTPQPYLGMYRFNVLVARIRPHIGYFHFACTFSSTNAVYMYYMMKPDPKLGMTL